MHKLVQSFARKKGEKQMKETLLNSKRRFYAFYVSLFEKLNAQFLSGHSMSAFIAFYDEQQSIVQSLSAGCSDFKLAKSVFDVLIKAELFLATLFYSEVYTFNKIYDSAIEAAWKLEANEYYCRLLVSKALCEVTWGATGSTMHLLANAKAFKEKNGKSMCYFGINQLAAEKIEGGFQCLQDALLLMNNSPEQAILKLVAFQILVVYYRCRNNLSNASIFYRKALQQCRAAGNTERLVIPPLEIKEKRSTDKCKPHRSTNLLLNQPLKVEVIFLLTEATKSFSDPDTKQYLSNVPLQILKETETEVPVSLGFINFQSNAAVLLTFFNQVVQDPVKLYEARISYHQRALKQCNESKRSSANKEEDPATLHQVHSEALVKCYSDLGIFHQRKNIYADALQSHQCALDMTLELFGEEHASTADSCSLVGCTQYQLGDFTSALYSYQRALDIRLKLFGENHASTADCYHSLGVTQHQLGDLTSALQSKQRALNIRLKTLEKNTQGQLTVTVN